RVYKSLAVDISGNSTSDHHAALTATRSAAEVTSIIANGIVLDLNALQSDGNGGFLIKGLADGSSVQVIAMNGFNQIEIENAYSATDSTLNRESFRLSVGGYSVLESGQGQELHLNFNLSAVDGDGDI